jgi:FAD/FMN-containing dehydrogenase
MTLEGTKRALGATAVDELRSRMRGPLLAVGDDASPNAVREAYGANYACLAALKAAVDPKNLFRLNQNIAPAA